MKFKKLLICLIACVFACVFVFAGCDLGNFSGATQDPGSNAGQGGDPSDPSTPTTEGFTSNVSIVLETQEDGERVTNPYTETAGMTAQWRSGTSVQSAEFGADGTASLSGLDGEYQVTINGLNEDYAYNTNAYVADYYNQDVVIVIYEIMSYRTPSAHDGSGLYRCIQLEQAETEDISIFSVELEEEGGRTSTTDLRGAIYFEFTPVRGGSFSITSWVDATADLVNPTLVEYFGTSAYVNENNPQFHEDGGSEGIYTRNFRFEINLTDDMVGNTQKFAIYATQRYSQYPVTVHFALVYEDEYNVPSTEIQIMLPEDDFKQAPEEEGTLTLMYDPDIVQVADDGTRYVTLDQRLVGLNSEDGYYHLLDESGQPNGPILYAYISTACPIYGTPIIDVEDPGNNALTVTTPEGERLDYQLVLQGYDYAFTKWEALGGVEETFPYLPYKYYGCEEENENLEDGEEEVHFRGYYNYANGDGMYPVTEQLKQFFTYFANSQSLFMDGQGWVELHTFNGYHYDAYEDSLWLWNCAYYAN